MGGSIVFYTYGSTLELYGQQFTAGMPVSYTHLTLPTT